MKEKVNGMEKRMEDFKELLNEAAGDRKSVV